jgi:release factor glutamine methyltransferase
MSVVRIFKKGLLTVVLFAVDISSAATLTTTATLEKNAPRQFNSVVQCDLLNGLRVDRAVDVLVFNPPYVPTDQEDSWAGDAAYAWRGGGMGMQTTWRVLDCLSV